MKKRSNLIAAIAVGAVGVMALGACSTGSDQAEANRDAAPTSAEPTAGASPTGKVLKAAAKGNFKDVTVTYSGTAKCSTEDKGDKLEISCKKVRENFAGDQVFVRLPNDKYRVHAEKTMFSPYKSVMQTTQRNAIYMEEARSHKDDVTWSAPGAHVNGWGVGVDGLKDAVDVLLTVTKV